MFGAVVQFIFGIIGLFRGKGSKVKAEERAGRAEANLQNERVARAETAAVIDARRAADERRLREQGTGTVTTEPGAGINRDDGWRRD